MQSLLVLQHDLSPYALLDKTCPPLTRTRMRHSILRERCEPGKHLDHTARKLLFEEYHRDPTGDFYQILGAFPRQVPLLHFLGEHTQESPLAQALVVHYASGEPFFSPKALRIDATKLGTKEELAHEIVTGQPRMNEFRAQFMLGTLVSHKPNVFKFRTNPEQLLKRMELQDATPFQLDYLTTNPYFTLEWDTMTLKFKSPFNETILDTRVPLQHVAHIPQKNIADAHAEDHNASFSAYGDTILNFDHRIVGALCRRRRIHNAPPVPFTQEDIYKYDLKPTLLVPHTHMGSGVAAILTHNQHVEVRQEDRFFGKPTHTEIKGI